MEDIRQLNRPTDENHSLVGTDAVDVIEGGGGNDSLYGHGGDDVLSGGTGDDYLTGEQGNDSLDGGEVNDRLYGNDGDELLMGETATTRRQRLTPHVDCWRWRRGRPARTSRNAMALIFRCRRSIIERQMELIQRLE